MKRMVIVLACFLTVLLLAGCAKTPKPTIHSIGGLYPGYDLQEAVDTATYIVYGKVVSKGRPKEVPISHKEECYRKVTLEVIDCAKGGLQAGDKVSYCEWGGETRNAIYTYDDTVEVAEGENVFVFLCDEEEDKRFDVSLYVLTPAWIWILEGADDLVYYWNSFEGYISEDLVQEVTEKEGYRRPRTVQCIPFTALLDAARALADELDAAPSDDAVSSRGENWGRNAV